jgi:hypothetical protein
MINKEDNIGLGWNSLIGKVEGIISILPFAKIASISKVHTMLNIKFVQVLDKHEQYVLDCIAYKIERESAKVCEDCGKPGIRRRNLPIVQVLCTVCYALKYNALMESVSPLVTNQEPQ